MSIDRGRIFWLLLLLGLSSGCRDTVDTEYGRRRGLQAATSLNGTSVLAYMFQQSGHRISSWRRLSPKLDEEQVIVWVPNDFAAPTVAQVEYLEAWLNAQSGRTLIYVGRDYDAATDYWQRILPEAAPDQRIEIRRKLADEASAQWITKHQTHEPRSCRWFRLQPQFAALPTGSLKGPWKNGLDASRVNRPLATLLLPTVSDEAKIVPLVTGDEGASQENSTPDGESSLRFETLLADDDRVLAGRLWRSYWDESQILVVANGSWLLNLPLVEQEHRKLAGRLIESCGPPGRVCFLESGPGGPPISESDRNLPLLVRAFTVWPLSVVLLHLTLVGILFCFCVFPIFGRPRRLPAESLSDFGKHVAAVGELLEKRGDAEHARQRIQQYHELTTGKERP